MLKRVPAVIAPAPDGRLLRQVDHAITDLRRGGFVLLADGAARLVVQAAEGVTPESLARLAGLAPSGLSLAPLDFEIAGGSLKTEVHIDGRKEPAKGEMKVSARGLQLRELFPTIEAMHASVGQLHGDAALNGSGNSIAALLATSNGSAQAVMTEGSVSKFILEAMGLNIGAAVAAKLFNEHQVQVNCMLADLDAKNGVMQTRTFVIDTKDELIAVNGDVDFANEKIALKIHPQTKGLRLFSLRSPLHVAGTFKKPDIGVDKGPVVLKAGAAVALGTVAAPLAALVALIHPGADAQSPCAALTSASAK